MTGWNDGARPRICRCDDCERPIPPPCVSCGTDFVELDEDGLCPWCRMDREEEEEEG